MCAVQRELREGNNMQGLAGLHSLYDEYTKDQRLASLQQPGISFVQGHGPLNPVLMLIGEIPGMHENSRLIPFVGKAGIQLTYLLDDHDIKLSNVFLTNVVKYWPVDMETSTTRPPTSEEIAVSAEYVKREIEIVNPQFVGLCGLTAIKAIFPLIDNIYIHNGNIIPCSMSHTFVALMHPGSIVRNQLKKPEVKEGFRKLAGYIKKSTKVA